MNKYIYPILSALLFFGGIANAQELSWSDFAESDTLSQSALMIFNWDAKRAVVKNDGVKYRYISVNSNLVSAQVRPECKNPVELERCQLLADYSKAWAEALQDTLLFVKKDANKVVDTFRKRYLDGLKEGNSTGIYPFPSRQETPFDITKIDYKPARNGVEFGLGATCVLPLGGFGELVSPIPAVNVSIGRIFNQTPIVFNALVGRGIVKDKYLHVSGPRREKPLPYLNLSVNCYQPVIDNGKSRLLVCGGLGFTTTKFSRLETQFIDTYVGGLDLSAGIAYDLHRGTTYNLEGNHTNLQNRYLRFRLYTDQILTKTAWMPTVNLSVSIISSGRSLNRN